MDILHAIILGALLQGLTEFLPISSSAHLILLPKLMDWADQGLLYDVGAHFGSLLALLIYFRKDLARMGAGWVNSFSAGEKPRCGHGVVPGDRHHTNLPGRSAVSRCLPVSCAIPWSLPAATILFALVLWWADSLWQAPTGRG